jgi:hypothetical protein
MLLPPRKLFSFLFLAVVFFSCSKETFTTSADALLTTHIDSLHFDTVFTTAGSTSQAFTIVNKNDEGLKISSVRLAGGSASPFRINVDGNEGPEATNIEVAANDSAYVFVIVSIDPNPASLPFVVRDSIEINYNGNKKWIQLDAYGQNAHFLKNKIIQADEVWNNDLPYVILGQLDVAAGASLTINEGCHIYLHADAPFIINGTLRVKGDKYDSTRVVFAGDRLDEPFRSFPASFPGLLFTESSTNNSIQYAMIKNAYQGIVSLGRNAGIKLTIKETVIDNAYDAGLLGINTSIVAENLLISNCGKSLQLAAGGDYNFTHCTVAAYFNNLVEHKEPVLYVSNFQTAGNVLTVADLQANFTNCIFWGEGGLVKDEVVIAKEGNTSFNVSFTNVLWNASADPANATVTGTNLKNVSPAFENIDLQNRQFNFRLSEGAPALNVGSITTVVRDLDGNPRPVGVPDLGAYERQ